MYTALPRGDNQNVRMQQEHYSPQMAVSPSDHYKAEDPYEWVAPRKSAGSVNPRYAGRVTVGHVSEGDRVRVTNQYSPSGRSFMNQMYMDHSELQRMKQQSQGEGYRSNRDLGYHGSKEGFLREQAYTGASERPR